MEYMIEMDCVDGTSCEEYIEADDWMTVVEFMFNEMMFCGGGHADVYDEDGNFVNDYEC